MASDGVNHGKQPCDFHLHTLSQRKSRAGLLTIMGQAEKPPDRGLQAVTIQQFTLNFGIQQSLVTERLPAG